MSCLHLVSMGPDNTAALSRLIATVTADDAVVLLGHGLQLADKLSALPCPCYQWDDASPNSLDAADVVVLTSQYDKPLSWH